MRSFSLLAASLAAGVTTAAAAVSGADLPISAKSDEVDSGFTAVVYDSARPLIVGNDGGASTGGFRTFDLGGETNLTETSHETPGRTKLVTTVYGIGGKDLIATIAQPDSYFRLYDASTIEQIGEPLAHTLGDWSALCAWRSQSSGEQYLYLFGKSQAVQFLMRARNGSYELVEVQTFDTEVEASGCAVSQSAQSVYYTTKGSAKVYTFAAAESTVAPEISVLGEVDDEVTGLTAYLGTNYDYLLVAQDDVLAFYNTSFTLLGSTTVTGEDGIELKGLSVYQAPTEKYPAGALVFALDADSGKSFAVSSLESAFNDLGLDLNTAYDPRKASSNASSPISTACNLSGFSQKNNSSGSTSSCSCFTGFTGANCEAFTCRNSCSAHGTCVGANVCECEDGWGGLYCAFKVVEPVAETDAYGGDGDDPAIWISPVDVSESRIITTTKSEEGSGLGVFDLSGKMLQVIDAGEPDNVDVIYGFQAGNRTIDLAYAACRTDNTLCLFEITSNGTLQTIAGGSQPTKDGYTVYGSCVYHSQKTGKQYLFVNAKTAEYLQYELTWADGALQTTFVRNFTGGSGGQVEGCVADEPNGWVFISEEPHALWRYNAEPDDDVSSGFLIDVVGNGTMYADNEGVTLVEGPSADQGYIIVSQQGVSAYNVYHRGAPHEYVETFTIYENKAKSIDAVTNTDGLAAVGAALGDRFPNGLVVVHDDANQLPEGGTSDKASFKLVDLKDVLGDALMADVDLNWNPRAS